MFRLPSSPPYRRIRPGTDARRLPDGAHHAWEAGRFQGQRVASVNMPRNDLKSSSTASRRQRRSASAAGSALTKGTGGMDVMMGDLVLTEDEVNPVMSALLDQRPRRDRSPQSLLLRYAAHLLHARARARHGGRPGNEGEAGARAHRQVIPQPPPQHQPGARSRGRSTAPRSQRSSATTASRTARSTRSRSAVRTCR